MTSEQLLKGIACLYGMSIQKVSVVAGSLLLKTPGVESQKHTMAFVCLGNH